MNDLFENYNLMPKNLSEICDRWFKIGLEGLDYNDCKLFLKEVQEIGYTFDFKLDAEPFNLRKIEKKGPIEILLFKVPNDNELHTQKKVCYKNLDGVFNKIGIITDIINKKSGKQYILNTSFGAYTADELRLIKE